jgi:cold shock CspA family protein
MAVGTVKFFNTNKGFGFIDRDADGKGDLGRQSRDSAINPKAG